jgi:hypothetical protein
VLDVDDSPGHATKQQQHEEQLYELDQLLLGAAITACRLALISTPLIFLLAAPMAVPMVLPLPSWW